MAYAILRIAKHSTNGSLGGMTKHNKREIHTPNADPERTKFNKDFIGTGNYVNDVNKFIESKNLHIQKNSVKAIEHMATASPEWWSEATNEQRVDFFKGTRKFLEEFYGPHSKVVSASLHLDESTPHAHYFVVPISQSKLKGGKEVLRLGATQFIGTREKLSKMQDMFAEQHKPLGLERGVKKSKAQHQTIKKLYSNLNAAESKTIDFIKAPAIEELPPRLGNRQEYLDKQNEIIKETLRLSIEQANHLINSKAILTASEQLQASKLKLTQETAEKQLNELKTIATNKINKVNEVLIHTEKDSRAKTETIRSKNGEIEGLKGSVSDLEKQLEERLVNLKAREVQLEKALKGQLTQEEVAELLQNFSKIKPRDNERGFNMTM